MKWPSGIYTLVKPWYGCPPGWSQGWTYQDNEDISNNNYISYGHHFAGKILKAFWGKNLINYRSNNTIMKRIIMIFKLHRVNFFLNK